MSGCRCKLLDWCTATRTPFIYASSAATYGDGGEGFRDDWSPDALKQVAADESLRLEQACVRSGAGRAPCQRREAAAAMGRPEILQRVRAERISQGHDGERAGARVRRGQSRKAGAAVQVAQARHRRRRPAPRLHLCRRCRGGDALAAGHAHGFGHLQCRHRQGAQLPRHDRGDVRRARPRAQYRIYRHAGGDPRRSISISRKPTSMACAAPATIPASRRWKTR